MFDVVVNDIFKNHNLPFADRRNQTLVVAGRLKRGVTVAAASARLDTLSKQLEGAYPADNKEQLLTINPLPRLGTSTSPSDDTGPTAAGALMMALSSVVLLIACLNIANMAYRQEISWDQDYNDVYLLDLKSGKPKKVLEHWGSNATAMSPGGKYVLYFDERNGHWFSYRVSDGARVNLTEKIPSKFQQENNTPDLPGPHGSGGWTADDKSVLLYDKFDIWEVKPDGSGAHMPSAHLIASRYICCTSRLSHVDAAWPSDE